MKKLFFEQTKLQERRLPNISNPIKGLNFISLCCVFLNKMKYISVFTVLQRRCISWGKTHF